MKTTARVVVIGGGVVGCSVLYHFTKIQSIGRDSSIRKMLNNPLAADLVRFYLERLEYWQQVFL